MGNDHGCICWHNSTLVTYLVHLKVIIIYNYNVQFESKCITQFSARLTLEKSKIGPKKQPTKPLLPFLPIMHKTPTSQATAEHGPINQVAAS